MRWNDRNGARLQNGVVEVLGVIGPVGDDMTRTQTFQQVLGIDDIATMTRRQQQAHRQAKCIDGGVDLGA